MNEGAERNYTGGETSENFIAEISYWMAEESMGKRETAHLTDPEFNPRELRLEDEEIWHKIKNETITKEEFAEYLLKTKNVSNVSVKIFCEFVSNLAQFVIKDLF
ncbi:MAG TPA: hypothetical protein VJL32_01970 [Candidatus Paceibacterota bacterium]